MTFTRTVTRRTTAPIIGPAAKLRQYLTFKAMEADAKAHQQPLRTMLLDLAHDAGEEDPDGHYVVEFTDPIEVAGRRYKGFRRQRRAPQKFLADQAEALGESKGILDQLQSVEVYVDQDKVARAHQEGLITDEEFDSLFDEDVTWALVADKA